MLSAPWLPRIITWTLEAHLHAKIMAPLDELLIGHAIQESTIVDDNVIQELSVTLTKINFIFVECSDRRQSTSNKVSILINSTKRCQSMKTVFSFFPIATECHTDV